MGFGYGYASNGLGFVLGSLTVAGWTHEGTGWTIVNWLGPFTLRLN